MDFRNNSTGLVENDSAIVLKYQSTHSFPVPITASTIEALGYTSITATDRPSVTEPYESAERDGIEEKDGKWVTKWKVITATGAAKTEIDNVESAYQRGERNSKLAETDYLALSDVTMSDDWKTYRQALRDLPANDSGWPHSITWPTKPS